MASRKKTHHEVEFFVTTPGKNAKLFRTSFEEAAAMAVTLAASDGRPRYVDVVIHGEAGAYWWGGDYAVEEYEADPEASVSERIKITAESEGRIP